MEKLQTLKGSEVTMGNGKANSFFTVNADGIPQEIGFEMTSEVFTGLTQDPANFPHLSFVLSLDQKAKETTAFDHIVIHWNPQGHPPANIFTTPHFDFNFYTITPAERMAIPPYMPSTAAKFDNLPPAGFMPASYAANPGGVPGLGKLWGDHHMQLPFTHTMVHGSYDGKTSFTGPMITKTIIESGTEINMAYEQPQKFAITNKYYPTKYKAYMDTSTHKHYVTLSDFVKR
ncbi:MAG TPA: hypothetical protein VNA26_06960 [Chitinophagaceae bacterium]|nr:hypothetical protein [Chitinophagaceae bacterium]